MRGAAAFGPGRPARRDRLARRAAGRAGAADRGRDRVPRLCGRRPLRAGDACLALSRARARRVRPRAPDDGGRFRHAARPPRGPGAPRRGQRHGSWPAWREAPRPDVRGRHPRGRRLSRRPRSGRHVHRHAQRGLRDREQRRRHLSARQRVVAHPAGRGRQRQGRRCEGRASDHPVLAGRGAGPQRRAVACGQRSARRGRSPAE